ncbi:response regulator [bacterium]|nr:response regulator [bacterium]
MAKILLIEDSKISRKIMEAELEKKGHSCISATDGLEGLKKAKEMMPDLILLDVMLPSMNGFKICRLLKFDKRYKKIPIIMLTTRNEQKDQKIGLATGADVYMPKPFDPDELEAEMQRLLGDRSRLKKTL